MKMCSRSTSTRASKRGKKLSHTEKIPKILVKYQHRATPMW